LYACNFIRPRELSGNRLEGLHEEPGIKLLLTSLLETPQHTEVRGGEWGKWHQDPNHAIELWLPLGIGWVIAGNHSLTVGILYATGTVKPEITYDISEVYDYVNCDGVEYKRLVDNSVISPVPDLEIAAMFEIGRLMHKHHVSF